MISEERAEHAVEFIRDNAAKIGALKGQKDYLEHHIKVARSQVFLHAEGTVGEKEAAGWVDQGVMDLIEERKDCITELETLATRMEAARLTFETWRSQSANQRYSNV